MFDESNVVGLVSEYQHLSSFDNKEDLVSALVEEHDWTTEGAYVIVQLAEQKGSFLLRNALALSLAIGIEDNVHKL